MFAHITIKRTQSGFACLLIGAVAALSAQAQDEDNWTQHLRVGAAAVFNIKADFQMGGTFAVSGSQPGPAGVSGVNHIYDDGYVKVDATGNAQGFTSFWGYQNASQFDGANTLTMHSATSYTTTGNTATSDDSVFPGVQAAYGYQPFKWGPAHIGFDLGFGWVPIKLTDGQALSATVNRSIFSFDTAGIVMPTAPYNGGSSGIGPTIHDVATALPGDTVAGTISGTRKLDVDLFTARLGPSVTFDIGKWLGITLSAGGAAGLVNGNYKFDERISTAGGGVAMNSGKIGVSEGVYGGYANAAIIYHVVERGDIFLGAEYMALSSVTVSGSGRQAHLDLSGQWSISAGMNWPF